MDCCSGLCACFAGKGAQSQDDDASESSDLFFELQALQIATGFFSEVNKLGHGGFGPVYKVKRTQTPPFSGFSTSHRITDEGFRKVASKFPMLEHLDSTLFEDISHETLALVGRSCPLLKSFKFNKQWFRGDCCDKAERNDCAFAIAGTMHGLHHLMLFRNQLSNKFLSAILDGCPHLESLDLRQCFNLKLWGKTGGRCAERIQKLWLPQDSIDDIDPSYDLDAEW